MDTTDRVKTPWHIWAVGIVMTLWNSIGCLDYTMTQTQNADYLAAYSSAQLDYFSSFPAWADGAWALGVWGAILGSVLILFRSRFSLYAYIISLLGLIISSGYHLTSGASMELVGGIGGLVFTGIIYIIAIGQLYYSKRMMRAGVLR